MKRFNNKGSKRKFSATERRDSDLAAPHSSENLDDENSSYSDVQNNSDDSSVTAYDSEAEIKDSIANELPPVARRADARATENFRPNTNEYTVTEKSHPQESAIELAQRELYASLQEIAFEIDAKASYIKTHPIRDQLPFAADQDSKDYSYAFNTAHSYPDDVRLQSIIQSKNIHDSLTLDINEIRKRILECCAHVYPDRSITYSKIPAEKSDTIDAVRSLFSNNPIMPYILANIASNEDFFKYALTHNVNSDIINIRSFIDKLLRNNGITLNVKQAQQFKNQMLKPLQKGVVGNLRNRFTKKDPELESLRQELDNLEQKVRNRLKADQFIQAPHPLMLDIRTSGISGEFFLKNASNIEQLQFFNSKEDLQKITDKEKLKEYINRNQRYLKACDARVRDMRQNQQIAAIREPITWHEVIGLESPAEKFISKQKEKNLKKVTNPTAHGNITFEQTQLKKIEKQLSDFIDIAQYNGIDLIKLGLDPYKINIRSIGMENNPALAKAIIAFGAPKDIDLVQDHSELLRNMLKIENYFKYEIARKVSQSENMDSKKIQNFKDLMSQVIGLRDFEAIIPTSFLVQEIVSKVGQSYPNPVFTLPKSNLIKNVFSYKSTSELQQEVVKLTNELRKQYPNELEKTMLLDIRFNGAHQLNNVTQEHLLHRDLSIDQIANIKNRELLQTKVNELNAMIRHLNTIHFKNEMKDIPDHVQDPSKPNPFDDKAFDIKEESKKSFMPRLFKKEKAAWPSNKDIEKNKKLKKD